MPATLEHERYCAEIIDQTRLFRDVLDSTPLDARVPSCPEWTMRDLAVHLGDGHRWAGEIVRTRAASAVPLDSVPGRGGPARVSDASADAAALDAWLAESAQLVSDELRIAGPEAAVWTFLPQGRTGFWARRRTHETLVHRADAALAAGSGFDADHALAADCIDEWLDIVASEEAKDHRPALRTLAERAGETLHLHATDTGADLEAEWLITLGEEGISWRRSHEKAPVALRGPVVDVLRVFFRRLPPTSDRVEVLGDTGLLDFWLERVSFA
ncbi:maleylpyruvate isomerase N-terminal domain-containing protein [Streptomyces ovatisporus]|uniref:Maleylpyruvate isomerase N-terminal domain-containing protein n=1 Tax=Streptomyces ovatisporus TaxID=1128682 RepID=A0ABV9A7Z6_9ACTN